MEIKLAINFDLIKIKFITKKIVKTMYKNNIPIWNEYYPFLEYKSDIKNKKLYKLTSKHKLIGFFVLCDKISNSDCFNFTQVDKYIYLTKFCINPKYSKQGYAWCILEKLVEYAKTNKIDSVRLTVSKINYPAKNLYEKFKFNIVDGQYENPFITKCSNIEYGYEYLIEK